MKKILIALTILFHSSFTYAQSELYMPLEFQKAYKNHSRSYDGLPGKNYWQNFNKYDIDVEIEPITWKITGKQTVVFSNNSPDSLFSIIIKTYPNHYKKGAARARAVPLADLTDGMLVTSLKINNMVIDMKEDSSVKEYSSFLKIMLTSPIPPKESIVIAINWNTELPPIYSNRIGAYDQESAFMGYWYPQIGVYDDIDGWDEYEYLGAQEFYRDFADFNVKISVPDSYKVWATGELQNPEQVLSKEEFRRYKESFNTGETVVINQGGKIDSSNKSKKTWIFTANNVQDFAAGISNNFRWKASSVHMHDKTISSNFVYDHKSSGSQKDLLQAQNEGLLFLFNSLPAMVYPYSGFTTFMGVTEYDGMEFPMIANNGFGSNEVKDVRITFHEMAHSYFPFFVGINEVKYSWMEEGWITYFTIKFIQEYYKGTEHENSELNNVLKKYIKYAGHQWESPLIAPSNHLVYGPSHSQLSYRKPAILCLTLEDLLGRELFSTCLKEYMIRWAGKHPTPYDFMFTFNDISKQNLNWFWQSWIFDYGYAELAIKEINESKVYIENIGRLPMPIFIKVSYKNGKEIIIHETANIWAKGDKMVSILIEDAVNIKSVELLSDKLPDVDKTNNILKLKQ